MFFFEVQVFEMYLSPAAPSQSPKTDDYIGRTFVRTFCLQQAAVWVKSLSSSASGIIQLAQTQTEILIYLTLMPFVLLWLILDWLCCSNAS